MGVSARYRHAVRAVQAGAFAALGAFALHSLLHFGGHGLDTFFNDWVYNALIGVSAAGCLARAVLVRQERGAWLALALGLVAWSAAEILSTVWINKLSDPPYPSIADALYLAFYPAVYFALVMLFRGRMHNARGGMWLDGVIAALAVAVAGELFVFH